MGGKDYLIAKRFDLDQDGKLSPDERLRAKAEMADVESNLVWGCDSSGNNRSFRIIQKRGNVILNEEFAGVGKSYPTFPAGGEDRVRSKTELQAQRKEEVRLKGKFYEEKMKAEYWREVQVKDEEGKGKGKTRTELERYDLGYRQEPRFRTREEMVKEKKKQLV